MPKQLFFLADHQDPAHIRQWLGIDGILAPAHESAPKYFDSPDDAYHYPGTADLFIHSCPAAETIPGAPVGTDIDDAVCAADIIGAIQHAAQESAALCRL